MEKRIKKARDIGFFQSHGLEPNFILWLVKYTRLKNNVKRFSSNESDTLWEWIRIPKIISNNISQNLSPKYELREYLVNALARFVHRHNKSQAPCYQSDSFPLGIVSNGCSKERTI